MLFSDKNGGVKPLLFFGKILINTGNSIFFPEPRKDETPETDSSDGVVFLYAQGRHIGMAGIGWDDGSHRLKDISQDPSALF